MARSPRHVAEVPEADVAMSVHRSAEHNRPTLRLAYMNWGLLNGAKSPAMIVLVISGLSTASPSQRRSSGRGSGSGPEPRRDLLDQPRVAVGIGEARERPVAGALGVGARLPRLDRERRAVPDVTHLDATADELVIGGLDVGDDQLPLGRAWRGRRQSLAERDRGPRTRGCELDDAKALHRGDVAVEVPTQALIEFLGSVDVGHGNDHDLELHVDPPDARVTACIVYVGGTHRYLLICVARNPQLGLRIGDATKRTHWEKHESGPRRKLAHSKNLESPIGDR